MDKIESLYKIAATLRSSDVSKTNNISEMRKLIKRINHLTESYLDGSVTEIDETKVLSITCDSEA